MDHLIIIIIAAVAVLAVVSVWVISRFRHVFCIPEGWAGLVYHHGLYVRRNNAGRHIIWGRGWTINPVDLRKTSLVVSSEDFILTDKVCLRIGPHISYQIIDPAKAAHETQHWPNELHSTALRGLHAMLGSFSSEELISRRLKISEQLLAHSQPEAAKIGISIHAIDLRCWILATEPGRHFIPLKI
jgi:regulator of protease activity HflC (stomatin/prohibitin superfamily)